MAFFMVCGQITSKDADRQDTIQARQKRGEIIDDNQDGQHDNTCMCGYCLEVDTITVKN